MNAEFGCGIRSSERGMGERSNSLGSHSEFVIPHSGLFARRGEPGVLRRFRIEWRGQKFFRNRYRVVVVNSRLDRLVVFGDGAIAFALRVVSIALLDVRP